MNFFRERRVGGVHLLRDAVRFNAVFTEGTVGCNPPEKLKPFTHGKRAVGSGLLEGADKKLPALLIAGEQKISQYFK